MNFINSISDIGEGIIHAPAWTLIILCLNLLGVLLQQAPVFPDKYNKYIGYLLLLLGIVLTPLLVPTTIFPPSQPHPKVLLSLVGAIFGIMATLIHGTVIQWVINKFRPVETNNK